MRAAQSNHHNQNHSKIQTPQVWLVIIFPIHCCSRIRKFSTVKTSTQWSRSKFTHSIKINFYSYSNISTSSPVKITRYWGCIPTRRLIIKLSWRSVVIIGKIQEYNFSMAFETISLSAMVTENIMYNQIVFSNDMSITSKR